MIVLRFRYRNHLDQLNDYAHEFHTIDNFKNYLRWEPERAMIIGYGKVDEERVRNSRTTNVKLSVRSVDGTEIHLRNATELGNYFKIKS